MKVVGVFMYIVSPPFFTSALDVGECSASYPTLDYCWGIISTNWLEIKFIEPNLLMPLKMCRIAQSHISELL
jgi:hypothetical protein